MRNYQVSSCFLSVKGGKLDWLRIATQLKNCGNPQLIMSATDDIAHHQGVIDRVIWGNAMPASIKTLGNGANCYFFKPVSLDNELGWVITGLRRYKKQLHEFVQIRDAAERHILLGNYTEAHAILDESLKKVGYTVWYYEMKLLIYGYQDNLQAVLTTLSNVNKEKKSDNTNLSILCSHNFSVPFNQPIAYAQKVGELTNMLANGQILVQRYGDILDGKRTWQKELAQSNVKPTLKDAVAGDITAAMPYRAMTNIIEFIKMLDMVVPGFAANETLLYSPELKFYSNKVKMDENLDTNIKGLHCLGDSSGWTRGLMMASVMGVLMGRKLAEKEGC